MRDSPPRPPEDALGHGRSSAPDAPRASRLRGVVYGAERRSLRRLVDAAVRQRFVDAGWPAEMFTSAYVTLGEIERHEPRFGIADERECRRSEQPPPRPAAAPREGRPAGGLLELAVRRACELQDAGVQGAKPPARQPV